MRLQPDDQGNLPVKEKSIADQFHTLCLLCKVFLFGIAWTSYHIFDRDATNTGRKERFKTTDPESGSGSAAITVFVSIAVDPAPDGAFPRQPLLAPRAQDLPARCAARRQY